ncbi:MAG: sugar phosphate isomerase/epimerase [Ferruginibacter sp.]|nr:sugar phosphate isomerase/epimerase [Ferruginibacter sp.]
MENERRKFLGSLATLSLITGFRDFTFPAVQQVNNKAKVDSTRLKISLNAYSFNAPLTGGTTTLAKVMDFCAEQGFDAIDITGYYFMGYPKVPADEYIFELKRKAHQLGLEISGTGIRNDFTDPDKSKRAGEVRFVKSWIEVAAKLGAPVIRIFTGKAMPAGNPREEVEDRVIADIISCVEHGEKHGVIVAVQNHNDFIKTAEEALNIIKKVNSEWFGLVLDTGSFVTNEPYSEIAKMAPYAVNWQVKEKLNYQGKEQLMDLEKLFHIVNASAYRGYLPIETLSAGDPFIIVPVFLKQVREALAKVVG